MEILKVQNVVKKFGDYPASNNVSFSAEAGHILGLLGPNGAGKTTLIRMITNIIYPDFGEIFLFGEPVSPKHQNRIGYLPEERGLYKNIKVIDQLVYFAQLKNLPRSEALQNAHLWLKKLDASNWANKKIQELSKGMQQKVQFISTILHNPEILILDEPFSGFDPINTEILKNIILDFKELGKTIILSTHIMEQAEQLCDDIILINKGKIVLSGGIRDIKKTYGKDTILIEFEGDSSFLDDISNVKFITKTNNRAEFRILNNEQTPQQILEKIVNRVKIYKWEVTEPSMHEIFIDVVSKQEVSQ